MGRFGGLGAAGAAILLVTAAVAPFAAIDTAMAAGNHATDAPADAPPRELKAESVDAVAALEAPTRRHESARDRARERLNDSRQYYRGPTRASDAALFTNDAVAVQALTAFAGTNASANATDAADMVLRADNMTAHQELRDARRLLAEWGDNVSNKGRLRSMEAHLDNAERASDRALRTIGRARGADGRRAIRLRAQSIRQLRLTWRQAHFVVERIVRYTNATLPTSNESRPDASLSATALSLGDPIRNGTGTRNYTVGLNVTSDGTVSLDSVTARVDGAVVVERTLSGAVLTDGQSAPVGVVIPLSAGGHRVTVTVTGNNGSASASGTVRLDGDGLNATYENRTLGTDPLDPDSDASETTADESDNGTVDGREDYDGDGLSTLRELELGTDPLAPDTDGEGLADRTELSTTGTDPTTADTDGDGTTDADEDPDGDGLTNAEEVEAGTVPQYADLDGDGLPDPAELANDTDPVNADTDDDFLLDGEELTEPFDTDPTDPDTDGDGVVDGNETYTTRTGNRALNVSVAITGEGNVARRTTVANKTNHLFQSRAIDGLRATSVVDIDSEASVENATVRFGYTESALDVNETDLVGVRYNESSGQFEPLPTTVDTDTNTVAVETEHFSAFTVLERSTWARRINATLDSVNVTRGNQTLFGNFSYNYSGDNNNGTDRIVFNKSELGGTGSYAVTINYTVRLNSGDGDEADATLWVRARDIGDEHGGTKLLEIEATSNKTVRETLTVNVSVGPDDDGIVMWCHLDNEVPGTSACSANLATRIGPVDPDGDGLSTLQEEAGVVVPLLYADPAPNGTASTASTGGVSSDAADQPVSNGSYGTRLQTDPMDADTDDDGITDGREVGQRTICTVPLDIAEIDMYACYKPASGPKNKDSDGDGLTDSTETNGWDVNVIERAGQPYRWAPSKAQRDGVEHFDSDPEDVNSDWDALNDTEEKLYTHTDPERNVTYRVTREHQALLQKALLEPGRLRMARQIGVIEYLDEKLLRKKIETLSDGSDDFDFVTTDEDDWYDRMTFQALDGNTRIDRWLANAEELRQPRQVPVDRPRAFDYATDPWDPDTDDDGLTDGQELVPHTDPVVDGDAEPIPTGLDPTDPDTDGDGYWDGWIGVYGVGYSENVILYREHLLTKNGIDGDEIVSEQAGVHQVDASEVGTSADVTGGSKREHSNIHIGELHWEQYDPSQSGDPTDADITPDPTLTIEVDYHKSVKGTGVLDQLELADKTYALYGIDVQYVVDGEDNTVTDSRLGSDPVDLETVEPLTASLNQKESHEIDDAAYMYITSDGGGGENVIPNLDWTTDPDGVASCPGYDQLCKFPLGKRLNFGIVILYQDIKDAQGDTDLLAAKTIVHETGHLIGVGRNDDGDVSGVNVIAEVYSGESKDTKPENIKLSTITERWSVMSEGWQSGLNDKPMNGNYVAFSIEELFTVEFHEIETH